MEEQNKVEATFNAEDASVIVKECVDVILSGVDYDESRVNEWMSSVIEQSLTHLVKMGKAYKYIVTCTVMQRRGAGLHTASSSFWDNTTDGSCTVRWENRTIYCVVNVFAVAIHL
ncbi:dynein light chain Tctex-type 3 isoform X1 [Bombina bombina]|uniref:dynein light chain Tctex-type 3 isoform X1 n=1 Tax=Bombina bombina TaxID=8345 RepID=UPI00235AEBCF|nr:dynein light chain Tctex-type 3 isoform X1 [Bombina bombina]